MCSDRRVCFLLLLAVLSCSTTTTMVLALPQHDIQETSPHSVTWAVCMTTIPPRFTSIHHTLRSWLQQQEIQPACLAVFVPKIYRRFKRRSHNDTATSMVTTAHLLERSIREHAPDLATHLDSSRIHVMPVETDYGPITKLSGLLHHHATACRGAQRNAAPIEFWVFGDDDVAYTPQTLLRYSLRMLLPPPGMHPARLVRTALTHFSEDVRLVVKLAHEETARHVRHLQGVDTVLLPVALLEAQRTEGNVLHPAIFVELLESAVLSKCPDAFYQDDYVIALLLNLGGVEVLSAWNNDHVAKHVEGVSKENSQMHMKAGVYEREEATKACLAKEADNIHRQRVSLSAATTAATTDPHRAAKQDEGL